MKATLAELEQQWAESCRLVIAAQDDLESLTRRHVKLGERIARVKMVARGQVEPRQPRQPSGAKKPRPTTACDKNVPHKGGEPPALEQICLDL